MNEQIRHFYEFGDYKIEKTERLLTRRGEVVPLPPKAVELLFVLLESGGRVITKDELMNLVWADSFVEEANLSRNVFLLRKVLGEGENGGKFIETIPRRGYRFVADVAETNSEEAIEIIAHERTRSHIVIEEEIETDDAPEKLIEAEAHQPASAPPLNLPPAVSRKLTPFVLVPLLILIIGAVIVGYFVLQPRRAEQNAPLSQQRLVSTFAGSHTAASFSPDGERIAFINEVNGVPQIWIKNLTGGEPVQITLGEEHAERPRWSPVGDEIAYVRHSQGKRGIWRISL